MGSESGHMSAQARIGPACRQRLLGGPPCSFLSYGLSLKTVPVQCSVFQGAPSLTPPLRWLVALH